MDFSARSFRSLPTALALSASLLAGCGGGHGVIVLPGRRPVRTRVRRLGDRDVHVSRSRNRRARRRRTTLGTRAPKYLSSATKSITVQVTDTKSAATGNADIYANVPAALKLTQTANFTSLTGTPSTPGQCGTDPSNPGNYMCTAQFQMPIGIDAATIISWDANGGTGNKLSQNIAQHYDRQGVLNTPKVSFDANAGTVSLSGRSRARRARSVRPSVPVTAAAPRRST